MTDDSTHDELDSRSARKRAAHAVRDLAAQLVALTPAQLGKLPLPEEIRTEVVRTRAITAHVAHKRELGHLAKLMRRLDDEVLDAARAVIEGSRGQQRREAAAFQRTEMLRERLLDGDDHELGAILDEHPTLDRQHLRSLLRQARRERERDKPPRAARELFRLLRALPDA